MKLSLPFAWEMGQAHAVETGFKPVSTNKIYSCKYYEDEKKIEKISPNPVHGIPISFDFT